MNQTYKHSGFIVCWKCSEESSHYLVSKAVESLGDQFKDCVPKPTTPTSCLKQVLEQHIHPDTKGHNILVRPLKGLDDRAFTVVQEDPKIKGLGRYKTIMTAVFYSEDHFDLDPCPNYEQSIRDAYRKRRTVLGSTAVGAVLADVAKGFHAVPLRDGGGVYWISDEYADAWRAFASDMEAAGNNRVYSLKVEADEEMVRCIGDNLVTQLSTQLNQLNEDLNVEEFSHTYLATRKRQLESIRQRATDFQDAFSRSLDELNPKINEVKTALATYTLMESAYDEEAVE